MNYWESRLIKKVRHYVEAELHGSFEELRKSIRFCTLADFIDGGSKMNTDPSIRAIIVYEPFLFSNKVKTVLPKIAKLCKKLTKRVFLISIMNDFESIQKILASSPMILGLMHFCISSEEGLLKNIKFDEKGDTINPMRIKQVFTLVGCEKFITRLMNEDMKSEIKYTPVERVPEGESKDLSQSTPSLHVAPRNSSSSNV